MGETLRFGVSMDSELVAMLDQLSRVQGHANRSETLRALVRQELATVQSAEGDQEVLATLTLLYNQGSRLPRLAVRDYPTLRIKANLQLHVDHDLCVKLLVLQGSGDAVRAWAGKLLSCKKVLGRLTINALGDQIKELGAH